MLFKPLLRENVAINCFYAETQFPAGGLVTELATTYKTIFWGFGISALVSSFHFQNLDSLISCQDDVS